MFERFTEPAREVVLAARSEAEALGHDEVAPAHLLLGVAAVPDAPGGRALHELGASADTLRPLVAEVGDELDGAALAAIGVDLETVRESAEETFGPGALGRRHGRRGNGRVRFTTPAKRTLEGALRSAIARRDGHIGTEHVLLGLLDVRDRGVDRVLGRAGLDREELRAAVADSA